MFRLNLVLRSFGFRGLLAYGNWATRMLSACAWQNTESLHIAHHDVRTRLFEQYHDVHTRLLELAV